MAVFLHIIRLLFCFLIFPSFGTSSDLYRCPNISGGIMRAFNEKCYRFVSNGKTWDEAQCDCQRTGGNLVHIKDRATQNFIYNSIKNDLGWRVNGMWIGAHDRTMSNSYEWVNGDRQSRGTPVTWNYWAPGQPSCGLWFCSEFCSQMRLDDGGRWHDYRCGLWFTTYYYCCMYDMLPRATKPTTTAVTTTTTKPTTTTTTRTTTSMTTKTTMKTTGRTKAMTTVNSETTVSDLYRCPNISGGIMMAFRNKCYRFVSNGKTWDEAQYDCQRRGGNLVHIKNLATQNFIYNSIKHDLGWRVNGMWIGAHNRTESKRYEWVNGDRQTSGARVRWNYWASGQPSCSPGNCHELCGQMRLFEGGQWHNYRCGPGCSIYHYCCMYDMSP
ncbi:C-type mannose receptor 2-like [Liolophura sinensis]|uniref:C-type mannose receptor 2-like n=1 Tax=Liolophura sinensis TaxID=3198878 RepID=UPI003158BB7A